MTDIERPRVKDNDSLSELAAAIADWAVASGAENIADAPGLWRGETDEWTVDVNGHQEEIDNLPFAHFRLSHKTRFAFAVLSPFGGAIVGEYPEDDLIAHFRAALQASEEPI